MPPLLLDDEQAVALVVALQTASTGVAGVDEAAGPGPGDVAPGDAGPAAHRGEALQVDGGARAPS